jgi:hypothetical protein
MQVFDEGLEYGGEITELTSWAKHIAQKVVSGKPV